MKVLVTLSILSLLMSNVNFLAIARSSSPESTIIHLKESPNMELELLNVTLYIPNSLPNQTVELLLTISSPVEALNTTAQLGLPVAFDLINGNLTWNGNVTKEEAVQIRCIIKPVKCGNWRIIASAESIWLNSIPLTGFDIIYISITTEEMQVSREPSQVLNANATCFVGELKEMPPETTEPGYIKVYGVFEYTDDEGEDHPIRYATVELYDDDLLGSELLRTTSTDLHGYYEFPWIENNDGWLEDGYDVWVKVKCYSDAAKVYDGNIDGIEYWGRTDKVDNAPDKKISIIGANQYVEPPNVGAYVFEGSPYHIMDRIIDAYEYIDIYDLPPSRVSVIWPDPDEDPGEEGSYYDTNSNIVYIEGPASGTDPEPDEWDESVIWHEYGHFIMDTYAELPSFPWSTEEMRWIEGWAEFFQSPLRDYYNYPNPEKYVETTWSISLETWTTGATYTLMASILWDIYDEPSDDQDGDGIGDNLYLGFDEIWDVFRRYDPDPGDATHNHSWTIDEFWDGWFARGHDYRWQMNYIFWEHGIDKNDAPSCTITSPNVGGWYSGVITITASASDIDGSVSQVVFQYSTDGSSWYSIGTDYSSPWSKSWNTTVIGSDSSVWVRARAYDDMYDMGWDECDQPFGVDNSPPNAPSISESHCGPDWTTHNSPYFSWSNPGDAGSGVSYYEGSINDGTPFMVSSPYHPTWSDGTHTFKVRAVDSVSLHSAWSNLITVKIDTTPPSQPTSFTSSHTTNVWSNDNTIYTCWYGASDTHSGVYGYSYIWSNSPTMPDATVDTTSNCFTSSPLSDGNWYCCIRTRDNAGNWFNGYTRNPDPFKIDTTAPSNPPSYTVNPPTNVWTNDDTIDVTLNGATDDLSGIWGYYYSWTSSPSDPTGGAWSTSSTLPTETVPDGYWYLNVRSKDRAGNLASGYACNPNPWKIDTTAPSTPTVSSSSHPNQDTWYNDNDPAFIWTSPSDVSGIAGCSYAFDHSSLTTPDETIDTTSNSKSYTDVNDGTWYFHVRAKDNAGNWGSAGHYRVKIDTTSPTVIGNTPTGTHVPIDTTIEATFSESMGRPSAQGAFSISPTVSGSFSWGGNTMIFAPDSDLAYDTTYEVTIDTGAMDSAGNHLQSSYNWQFTTTTQPNQPPSIIDIYPDSENGSQGNMIRIYCDSSDPETAESLLTCKIWIRPAGDSWVVNGETMNWDGSNHCYDWNIPTSTKLGYYDVKCTVSDGELSDERIDYNEFEVLDGVPPTITIEHDPGNSTVCIYADDPEPSSGLAAIYLRIDGGSWEAHVPPFYIELPSDSTHQIEAYAVDNAGNESPHASLTVHYLTVNTDPSGLDAPTGQGWYDYNCPALINVSTVPDYQFQYWYLDGQSETLYSTSMNTTVTMDIPHTATAKFQFVGVKWLDFGMETSAVEAGYIQITPSTLYCASVGYGWDSSTGLYSRDRGSPDNLRRDLVFSSVDRTFKVDVTNGAYLVMVIVGDQSYMHDNICIYAENTLKVDVSVGTGEFVQKVFVVSIADDALDLMFHDGGGSDSHWVINALLIQPYSERKFDFGTESSPVESGYTQVLSSTSYSESADYGWADTVDLDSRDRGAPDNLRRDFVFSSSNRTFNIDLPNGKYMVVLVIGDNSYGHDYIDVYCEGILVANDLCVENGYFAEVAFLAEVSGGQLEIMFCDDGGANAHWVVNAIHAKTTFDLRLEFDFGTSSSPVEDGYVRVTPATAYLLSTSYGWSDIADLWSRDRGAPDAARRDLAFSSSDRTFNVDIPNGQYQVTLIVGDQNYMHDKIDIYAEGVMVADDLNVSAETFTEVTFTVTVSDGQLNVTFHDDGGADANWVINALTIDSFYNS